MKYWSQLWAFLSRVLIALITMVLVMFTLSDCKSGTPIICHLCLCTFNVLITWFCLCVDAQSIQWIDWFIVIDLLLLIGDQANHFWIDAKNCLMRFDNLCWETILEGFWIFFFFALVIDLIANCSRLRPIICCKIEPTHPDYW